MPPATQRTQGKRPGDLTGVRGQQLAKARDQVKAEVKADLADSLEAERLAKLTTEVDYSSEAREAARAAALAGVVEETEVEVRAKTRRIRVNYPIDDMTFGREVLAPAEYDEHGVQKREAVLGSLRSYSFEEGRWYTVDTDLADHLAYLGYIYE